MNVLYAASEAVPFCKTGGLADVAGSLPPALAEQGVRTAVILPLYQRVKEAFGGQLTFAASTMWILRGGTPTAVCFPWKRTA